MFTSLNSSFSQALANVFAEIHNALPDGFSEVNDTFSKILEAIDDSVADCTPIDREKLCISLAFELCSACTCDESDDCCIVIHCVF